VEEEEEARAQEGMATVVEGGAMVEDWQRKTPR
jgi:hypothetical protein